MQDESRQHLIKAQKLFSEGGYEASLKENRRALSLSGGRSPGDEAIFNMAIIYAHHGNPKKDYGKSINCLRTLLKDYPLSPRSTEAKIWVEVMQENEKLRAVASETAQENTRLKAAVAEAAQENNKLKHVIEQSRKVDMEIADKKREKAR